MCRKVLRTVLPLLMLSFMVLFSVGSSVAEEAATAFELPPSRGGVDLSGADLSGLDTALGLVGLPGTGGASAEGQSAYEQAWQRQSGLSTTYGERYRRNPDGSYGSQGSSQWNTGNIGEQLLEQALSAGSGYFSSWAEGFLGGYGKARISVRVNDDGDFTGSGDFLVPWYDSQFTTFFTQVGLRTMTGDRVIGNFGLGQRFFPSENFALGYNLFIDQDFSRNHTRGGVGVEAWYDWLRLAANYYNPISGWKGSRDYDHRLVEERPAEGFDLKLTGYLPFYRNLAVTGGVEKWKGDHVGSFGRDDVVQKDPKIWSYGLEWTPAPVVSASVQQRHSGGQRETQFGLTFNYHFDMPWEDQLTSATVAEMRTVDGSRHDFVSRQNDMILEYRAKDRVASINLVRALDADLNIYELSLTDGFGQSLPQRLVTVTAGNGATVREWGGSIGPVMALARTADQSSIQVRTDDNGLFRIQVIPVAAGTVPVTITHGEASKTLNLQAKALEPVYTLEASPTALTQNTASAVTFTVKQDGSAVGNNVSVTLKQNANFSELASDQTLTTNTGGQISQSLTATAIGSQTVSAVVDGQTVSVTFTVTAAPASVYTIEASTTALTQNTAATVTFTVKQDGSAVGNNVSVTLKQNANFSELATDQTLTTDAGGQISQSLTATATGTQTVSVVVDGQTVSVSFTVTAAPASVYTVEASPTALTQNTPQLVTFTIKKDGSPVSDIVSVTLKQNANFSQLAAADVTLTTDTSGSGQVTQGLTATATGSQTIAVVVDGNTVNVAITVNLPPSYSMETTTTTLTENSTEEVTITVKNNGVAVGANVALTLAAKSTFNELASDVVLTTDNNGQVKQNLTANASGYQTISASVNNISAGILEFTVAAAPAGNYSIETASPAMPLLLNKDTYVVFTVKNNDTAVPENTPVTFVANSKFPGLPTEAKNTDANGQIGFSLKATESGTQTITVDVNGSSASVDLTVSPFIYVSSAKVEYQQAVSTCAALNGRLPLVNNQTSYGAAPPLPDGTPIDGFGAVGSTDWPLGTPSGTSDTYWTGTVNPLYTEGGVYYHSVKRTNGRVATGNTRPSSDDSGVVCVPQ